jgi:competence protein ComGC
MDDFDIRRPRGFRLIDLCVGIVILGILAALVVPAIQRTRDAAACTQCQNNLKQIVLGIHDYASTYNNALPSLSSAPRQDFGSVATYHPQSLFFTIMPFIECCSMYKDGMLEPTGQTWKGIDAYTRGPIFSTSFSFASICPTDSSNSRTQPTAHGWVGSSYAANAQVFGSTPETATDSQTPLVVWNILHSDYNIGNIPDGTSNTIFIAERFALAGPVTASTPCAWTNPPAGGSLFGDTDALGCPLQTFVGRHGVVRASVCGPGVFFGCGTREDPVGAIAGDGSVPMYPLPEIGVRPVLASTDGRAQSQHSTVVQVGMGDGSARGVSRKVSQVTWVRAISPANGDDRGDW